MGSPITPYFWHGLERRELAGPCLQFDLESELAELKSEHAWQSEPQNAKTLLKFPDLRVVLMLLKQGTLLKEHKASGRMTMQVLEGRLRLHVGERTVEVGRGQILALDRTLRHDVFALVESAVLLTVAIPETQ